MGAHWAAVCQLSGLAGEIAAEFAGADAETLAKFLWDSEPSWMAHSMLGALIQLRHSLAAPLLESIAKGFLVEATILMLEPRRNAEQRASIAFGGPTVHVPPNFPMVGMSRLTSQHGPGDELVSNGPAPM